MIDRTNSSPPRNIFLRAILAALVSQGLAQAEPGSTPETDPTVNIAPTSTQVEEHLLLGSITMRVDLDISELALKHGTLRGSYHVNVDARTVPAPFRMIARGKNEAGQISLPLKTSFSELIATGGTLKGLGYCAQKNVSRAIVCEVIPYENNRRSGTIKLSIDTGNRVMNFVSQYIVKRGMQLALSNLTQVRETGSIGVELL